MMAMHRIIIAATLLLSLSSLPAYADKNNAPTLKILTANGFGCKAVDSGILHCSNPNTKDEYDCSQNPDAPCQGTPPAPQQKPRLPWRDISTGAPTAETSARGSSITSL